MPYLHFSTNFLTSNFTIDRIIPNKWTVTFDLT